MNGVLTAKGSISFEAMWDHARRLLERVFTHARCGMAFNVMSKQVDWEREDLLHVPLDSLAQFLAERLTRHFVIRNDYGLYDYTAYVYRRSAREELQSVVYESDPRDTTGKREAGEARTSPRVLLLGSETVLATLREKGKAFGLANSIFRGSRQSVSLAERKTFQQDPRASSDRGVIGGCGIVVSETCPRNSQTW